MFPRRLTVRGRIVEHRHPHLQMACTSDSGMTVGGSTVIAAVGAQAGTNDATSTPLAGEGRPTEGSVVPPLTGPIDSGVAASTTREEREREIVVMLGVATSSPAMAAPPDPATSTVDGSVRSMGGGVSTITGEDLPRDDAPRLDALLLMKPRCQDNKEGQGKG